MPPAHFLSCLLFVVMAFVAALSSSLPPSQLSHKELKPGFSGVDFETSPRMHEWAQVSRGPPTCACNPTQQHAVSPCVRQVSRAPRNTMHSVHFLLQPRNMGTIYEIADAVSDPE